MAVPVVSPLAQLQLIPASDPQPLMEVPLITVSVIPPKLLAS
jgi:hypothetical protein